MTDPTKIISMLQSPDHEMFRLGCILALNQGPEWCLHYIPPFGYVGAGSLYPNAIKCSHYGHATYYTDGRIIILVSGSYLQCRFKEFFKEKSLKERVKFDIRDEMSI